MKHSPEIAKRMCEWIFRVRNLFAPYRGQNPQNREKRVSESKKPFPAAPEKGALSQKGHCRENKDFYSQHPFLGQEVGVLTLVNLPQKGGGKRG